MTALLKGKQYFQQLYGAGKRHKLPDERIDKLIEVFEEEYGRSPRSFGELLEVFN